MNKFLLFFTLCITVLVGTNNAQAKKCDYKTITKEIEKQSFEVRRKTNSFNKISEEKIAKFADTFKVTKEEIKLKGLNSIEYSFEDKVFNINDYNQFLILAFDTEEGAIKFENSEKKAMLTTGNTLPDELMHSGLDASNIGLERIKNYVAVFLFGKKIREKSAPILNKIKECEDFDFENLFSKSSLPISFNKEDLKTTAPFRNDLKELAASQDAMYTSELKTENNLNKKIEVNSKQYTFNKKYKITDDLSLKNVVLKLKNTSDEAFLSVDVFVVYYDKNNEIIEATRSTSYTIGANSTFENESKLSGINRNRATSAFVAFIITNPLPPKE